METTNKQIESITIPYNKVPNENLQAELRHAMEIQFRHRFYNDQQFPFLQSLGIKNVLQAFGNEEIGFIGVLHLWWVNEDNGIVYDNPRKCPVKIKGIWKSEWLNDPKDAVAIAQKLEDGKPYNESKLFQIHQNHIKSIMEKHAKKEILNQMRKNHEEEEQLSEEIPENILWN